MHERRPLRQHVRPTWRRLHQQAVLRLPGLSSTLLRPYGKHIWWKPCGLQFWAILVAAGVLFSVIFPTPTFPAVHGADAANSAV